MNNITFEEISQIIKYNFLQKYLFEGADCYLFDEDGNDDLDAYNIGVVKAKLVEANFTNYEQVEHVCNSDKMYCVIHFKTPDIYIKLIGEYDSHNEYDHYYNEAVTQVFPKEITNIVYE